MFGYFGFGQCLEEREREKLMYEKGFKFKGFLLQRFVSIVMAVCLAC